MKNQGRNTLIVTLTLILLGLQCRSQEARRVTLTKYTQSDGLSSYFITKIIQDSYGFIWIGTHEGLNLFDGRSFQLFSNQSSLKHRLGGILVSDLVEDKKRSLLWVLTTYGDVCAIDMETRTVSKRIAVDGDGRPLSQKWMRCLQINNDTLWIGGHDDLLAFDIINNRYLKFDFKTKSRIGSGEYNISKMTFDQQGRMWLGSEGYGIIVLDKKLNHLISFRDRLKDSKKQNRKLLFFEMLIKHDQLFVATSWGLRMFALNEKSVTYLPGIAHGVLSNSEIQSMTFGPDQILLFSTPERFYSFDFASRKSQLYQDENIEENGLARTFQICYDSLSQKVWAGTQEGLACFLLRENPFTAFSKSIPGSARLRHLYAVLPVSDSEVYAGDENGIFYINILTREVSKIDTASSNYLLFKDRQSNLFVSNKNGFQIILGNRLKPVEEVFPELKELNNDHLSCAIQYNDTLILFGSIIQKGLTLWNTQSHQLKTFHKDSVNYKINDLSIINYLFKGNGENVFVLTEKSIIAFNPLTEKYSLKNIQSDDTTTVFNNFMDMCETREGYWIGTYGQGLIHTDTNFRIRKIFNQDSGLSNNCVYRVFAHGENSIIATTNNGLCRIETQTNKVKNYFQSDGLHSNGFEQLCGYQRNEKIYCGGVNGFTIVDPAYFYSNLQPPLLYFHSIKIESSSGTVDTSNLKFDLIKIPNDVHQTTIYFSGLNYINPTRVTYSYKIEELSDDWINLGNQNFINLIGLNPGAYTLQVQALNEDGVLNSTPLNLSLVYLPKWFQTFWFKIFLVAAGLIMIYLFYLNRITQIKRQQQIRKEISNDLHDDIGSTLNTLKIFAHLAKKDFNNKRYLDQIEESISYATVSLRDMIWVLDDKEDTFFELMERIKKIVFPVCNANNINFVTTIETEITKRISKTEKRNLLLIAKESINNSIKYSKCNKIHVILSQVSNQIKFCIVDDGIGFDVSRAVYGQGLASIQHRAKQINYGLDIISSPLSGTRIELKK